MINLIHPQSKLQQFLEGFWCIYNAIYFRFDLEDNIDRCAFFYEINIGWYEMYDPDEKIYVTEEDYDAIMKAINEPPKYIEGLANLMKRTLK